MDLGVSGLASGFDWRALVDQLVEVERVPQQRLRSEQADIKERNTAYSSLKTELQLLRNKLKTLQASSFFTQRIGRSANEGIATIKASAGVPPGTYNFKVTQLATAAVWQGSGNVGRNLSATSDVSGVVISEGGFSPPVTPGVFSVNGKQVTVATTDTLQQVFDKIAVATGNTVSAAYDPATDKVTFAAGSEIVLGTATDTSNFLQTLRLYNNGTGVVTSTASLGTVKTAAPLASAGTATTITDGTPGAGKFAINGVEITFDAATDTVQSVLERINNSGAGVTASYDATADRFLLTNKVTGDSGIAMEDISGNFLAATGLSTGALQRGKDLLYSLNGGTVSRSSSNTLTESSTGVTGLSITAVAVGETTLSVDTDTTAIRKGITEFVDAYNRVQGMIDTQTASSTDAKGKVTAGVLALDREVSELASRLRGLVYDQSYLSAGSIRGLADLGIATNGTDDKLALSDEAALDAALANNLPGVANLFSSSNGLVSRLDAYLEKTIGDDGSLVTRQDNLTKQVSGIDTQIADMERTVQATRQRLINSFLAMEQAQARVNQQLSFLQQKFGGATAAK